ncbi:MAG: hypothetical protein QW721_01150 [Desulfurococcaceae archaeon]
MTLVELYRKVIEMLPKGIDVKRLNKLVEDLRSRGLWAERHSYSIRIMYNDLIVASLHLYPGFSEAVLRLYGGGLNKRVQEIVEEVLVKNLPGFNIKVQILR